MTKQKVTFSVRIHEDVAASFDQKIIDQYSKTRNYKAEVVEKLLKNYIDNDNQQQMLEKTNQEIQTLQQQVKELQQKNQQTQDQLNFYKNQSNDIQQKLDKSQQKLDTKEQKLEDITAEHKRERDQLKKEKNTWSNKYSHIVEVNNKLQEENSNLHNKLEKYTYFFGKVISMSLWNRILGNFPEEIKELQPPMED